MINRNSKKTFIFSNFISETPSLHFELPFYSCKFYLPPPSSIALPKNIGYIVRLFTHPSSLQMIQSYIQSVLILLENFLSGENTRHKNSWPLLRRY